MIPILLLVVSGVLMSVALSLGGKATTLRRPWTPRVTVLLALGALAWTVLAGTSLLFATWGHNVVSVTTTSTGVVAETRSSESLLQHEGSSIVYVLLIPVGLTLIGAPSRGRSARPRRIGAGALLMCFCVLGITSIGLFYVPAAVLLIAAGVRTRPCHLQRRSGLAAPN